jgi:hypothetical protein
MSKSKWELYKEKHGSTFIDVFNPHTSWVETEESKRRFDICKQCPELLHVTNQCKKCGCFMLVKTKIEASKCPEGKW